MCIPLPMPKDIRYRLDLAGGATMDTGCYAIHMNRSVAGAEPSVVERAGARPSAPASTGGCAAELHYPGGVTGTMTCALWSSTLLKVGVRAFGTDGELRVFNPTGPQFGYRMTRAPARRREGADPGRRREDADVHVPARAFVAAVRDGVPPLTPPADAVAQHGGRRRDLPRRRASGCASRRLPAPERGARGSRHGPPSQRARTCPAARVGLGLVMMASPRLAFGPIYGAGAGEPAAQALGRMMGAREAVLGAGGAIAVGERRGSADWLSMIAVADGIDALVNLGSRRLGWRGRVLGVIAARVRASRHLVLAKQLAARRSTPPA